MVNGFKLSVQKITKTFSDIQNVYSVLVHEYKPRNLGWYLFGCFENFGDGEFGYNGHIFEAAQTHEVACSRGMSLKPRDIID